MSPLLLGLFFTSVEDQLKNIKNRHIWSGIKVHECIHRSLNNIQRGVKVLSNTEIISIILDRMRGEFRSSKAKNYLKNPKTCALFEHEYGMEVSDEQWKEMAGNVEICLGNFYTSEIYSALKSHPKERWLEVEEFSSFHLDDFKINLAIDCALKERKDIIIYDWKTGKSIPENLSTQLCCYALYAMEKWQVPPQSLRVIEYNLFFNEATEFSVTQGDVKNIKGYIRGSIEDMRSLLADARGNIPLEEEKFDRVNNERICLRCNFRKVCNPLLENK